MSSLKFSVHENRYISISSSIDDIKIDKFFENKFHIKFNRDKTLISLANFFKKKQAVTNFLLTEDVKYELTDEFMLTMRSSATYKSSINKQPIPEEIIKNKLLEANFKRVPNSNQIKNLQKLCSLQAAASFSVPGAGKTTEALSFYAFHRKTKDSKLLVFSPINAFISWKDEIRACFKEDFKISRLRGSSFEISEIIKTNPQFSIINYEALRSDEKLELVRNFIIDNKQDITVILDESHKIKGENISEIITDLAPFIDYKLILTGTPMPQASTDLVAQFKFLYPSDQTGSSHDLIDKFEPIYVRTTKDDLGLYDVDKKLIYVEPNPAFKLFYDEYIKKNLVKGMLLEEILIRNSLKDAVLKLLRFFSNPYSCIEDIQRLDPGLAIRIEQEGYGAKIDALIERAKYLTEEKNEKIIIWSYFRKNVELIADKFGNKAEFIHGGVKSKKNDEDDLIDLDSREHKINRFKNDPECMILVANPAAAAESISLHEHCNYALYLDRTFNAGQFLQSQDRIHRYIEKSKEKKKTIEIFVLNMPGSIEENVHNALNRKIENMSEFLNDCSLEGLVGFTQPENIYSNEDDSEDLDLQTEDFQIDSLFQG